MNTSNSETTNAMLVLRTELGKRLGCTISVMSHAPDDADGKGEAKPNRWYAYAQPSMKRLHEAVTKKELVAWLTGATFGLAHRATEKANL